MKVVWDVLLLVGLFPGTVLPSFLTEQLIAPSSPQVDLHAIDPTGNESSDESEGSNEPDATLGVPSVYSAIRPATFPYTKGDLRTISRRSECPVFSVHSAACEAQASGVCAPSPQGGPEETIYKTRRPANTAPARWAHAPPLRTTN